MDVSLIHLFLVLLVAWLGGALASRIGYPSILGEILAGVLFGPPILGWIHSSGGLVVLAEIGVFLMMLYVGMEIDPTSLKTLPWSALFVALGGYLVPFLATFFVAHQAGLERIPALLAGTVTGVTSLAIMSRIFIDLKLFNTRLSVVLMAGALIGDTVGLLVFAGVVSMADLGGVEPLQTALILGKAALFFVVTFILGWKVIPVLGRRLTRAGFTERTANFTLVLMVALIFAEMAELAGLHSVLGAFFAGLFLHEGVLKRKLSHELTRLVHDLSLGFLAPIFFVLSGFRITLNIFAGDLRLLVFIVFAAFFGKLLSGLLGYLASGMGWREGLVVGAGLNARGGVDIILAGIALELGLVNRDLFSILVFTGILTTLAVPPLLKFGVRWLRRRNELVELEGARTGVIIVGAGHLARFMAKMFPPGTSVVFIDSNKSHVQEAAGEGFEALAGNALHEDTMMEIGAGRVRTLLALTPNAEVNVLVSQRARDTFLIPEVYAVLTSETHEALDPLMNEYGIRSLFGRIVTVEEWDHYLHRQETLLQDVAVIEEKPLREWLAARTGEEILPLVVERNGRVLPAHDELDLLPGDHLKILRYEREHVVLRDRFDRIIENSVILDLEPGHTMETFFRLVARILAERLNMDSDRLYEHLISREQQSSTVLTPILAIPHILIPGDHRLDILVARSHEGVQFTPDAEGVHIIFVIVGTPDERNFHLRALSAIAQVVQNPNFEEAWLQAEDAESLRRLILNAERRRFPDLDYQEGESPH